MGRCVLLLATLVLVAAWCLYTPVPSGFSKPLAIRIQATLFTAMHLWVDLLEVTGISPWYVSLDKVYATFFEEVEIPEDIDAQYAKFDGVTVKIYRRKNEARGDQSVQDPLQDEFSPGLIFIHGGGWYMFDSRNYDRQLYKFVQNLGLVVVSVEYRYSTEAPFPGPFEDSLRAAKHFISNARKFGVDERRIGIMGDSAGGNLAAAVTIKLRDESFPIRPAFQVILYPILQPINFYLPSYQKNCAGRWYRHTRFLAAGTWSIYITGNDSLIHVMASNSHTSPEIKHTMAATYLNTDKFEDRHYHAGYRAPPLNFGDSQVWESIKDVALNPYCAPLMAADLSDLPKALVITVDEDMLRDDGILYANRLKDAGVNVRLVNVEGAFHGIFNMEEEYEEGKKMYETVSHYIRGNI